MGQNRCAIAAHATVGNTAEEKLAAAGVLKSPTASPGKEYQEFTRLLDSQAGIARRLKLASLPGMRFKHPTGGEGLRETGEAPGAGARCMVARCRSAIHEAFPCPPHPWSPASRMLPPRRGEGSLDTQQS